MSNSIIAANSKTDISESSSLAVLQKVFVFVLILISIFNLIKLFIYLPAITYPAIDYGKHHVAAVFLVNGINPYEHQVLPFTLNYPLFVTIIHSWLALFSEATGMYLWHGMNAVLIFICAWVVWKFYKPMSNKNIDESSSLAQQIQSLISNYWWAFAIFLTINYFPTTRRMFHGNVDPTTLFFMTLFGAAWYNRKEKLAGIFLACSTLVKIMPCFFVLYLVITKKWKILQAFFLTLIVYLIFLWSCGWFPWEWEFYTKQLPNIAFNWVHISTSIPVAIARFIFPEYLYQKDVLTQWSLMINLGFIIPFTGGVLWYCRKILKDQRELGFIFTNLAMPLLSPLLEYIHYTWVFPSWILMFVLLAQKKISRLFYISLPLWLFILFAGDLENMTRWNDGQRLFAFMLIAEILLWLIAGIALLLKKHEQDKLQNKSLVD